MLRCGSPDGGSSFTTSAPQSASRPAVDGPAIHIVSSTTFTPLRTGTSLISAMTRFTPRSVPGG